MLAARASLLCFFLVPDRRDVGRILLTDASETVIRVDVVLQRDQRLTREPKMGPQLTVGYQRSCGLM
jgi:hypothetical protein